MDNYSGFNIDGWGVYNRRCDFGVRYGDSHSYKERYDNVIDDELDVISFFGHGTGYGLYNGNGDGSIYSLEIVEDYR